MRLQSSIYKVVRLFVITGFLAGILIACSSSLWNRNPPPSPKYAGLAAGTAGGAVIGGAVAGWPGAGIGAVTGAAVGFSIGSMMQRHYTLVEKLQHNGVQVTQIGDEITLFLPTDRFFKKNSPMLNLNYNPVLNLIGRFLNQFTTVSIKVAGYTDDKGLWRRNLALSRAQAQQIMMYLWTQGMDVRLIYAVGFGGKYPIANNQSERGRVLNRRVEISLRKIDSYNDF